jgi:HSP20 family protein
VLRTPTVPSHKAKTIAITRKEITEMSTLTRWEPLKELEDLQNRLSSLLGRTPVRRTDAKEEITLAEWAPLADISEDDKEYIVKAELPEVKKEDVKVTLEKGVLTISGERKFEKEEKNKKYHRVERAYGSFVRSFMLPEDADAENVKAEFKDAAYPRCMSQRPRRPNPRRLMSPSAERDENLAQYAAALGLDEVRLIRGRLFCARSRRFQKRSERRRKWHPKLLYQWRADMTVRTQRSLARSAF